MNFVILKKKVERHNSCIKTIFFQSSETKKRIFQSLGMKIKLHVKFKDENNSLTKKIK